MKKQKKKTPNLPPVGDANFRTKKGKIRQRKPGGGRKRELILNAEQVTKLARYQLTAGEIASLFSVSKDTIQDHYKEAMEKGYELGKHSMRRAQYILGVHRLNPTMLIWLGKQYLGQAEKFDVNPDGIRGFTFVPKTKKPEETA